METRLQVAEGSEDFEALVPFSTLQDENRRALEEAQEPGTRVPFWQFGTYVLLGPGHRPEHYQHLLDRGAAAGWATVVVRGNGRWLDPGLFRVVGSTDPDSFAWTVRQFSDERLEFA